MSSCISLALSFEQGRSGVLTAIIFEGVDIIKLGSGIAPDASVFDGVEQKALDGVEQKASLCPQSAWPPPLGGLEPGSPGQHEGVEACACIASGVAKG